jgi:hypothetical protein
LQFHFSSLKEDCAPVNCHSYNSVPTHNKNLIWSLIWQFFFYLPLALAGSGSISYTSPWVLVTTFLTICL